MGGPGLFHGEDDMGDASQEFLTKNTHVDTVKICDFTTFLLWSFAKWDVNWISAHSVWPQPMDLNKGA